MEDLKKQTLHVKNGLLRYPAAIPMQRKKKTAGILEKEEVIDATGKYVIPGLVDIHTHGAVNADASDGDEEGLRRCHGIMRRKV